MTESSIDRRRGSQPVDATAAARELNELLSKHDKSAWPDVIAEWSQRFDGRPPAPDLDTVTIPPCPAWCQDGHHAKEDLMTGDGPTPGASAWIVGHTGPMFGAFGAGGNTNLTTGETVVSIDLDSFVLDRMGLDGASDPTLLRQVAADAAAAAAWLEGQQ